MHLYLIQDVDTLSPFWLKHIVRLSISPHPPTSLERACEIEQKNRISFVLQSKGPYVTCLVVHAFWILSVPARAAKSAGLATHEQ